MKNGTICNVKWNYLEMYFLLMFSAVSNQYEKYLHHKAYILLILRSEIQIKQRISSQVDNWESSLSAALHAVAPPYWIIARL